MSGNGRNYPQIDISQKPKDGSIAIYSGGGDITFTVTKGTINVPEGFTKYIHKPNNPKITLNGKLENKSQIGTAGRSISNVTEVLVYHWNGAPTEPILLRIKHDNKNIPEYYGKHGQNYWFPSLVSGMDEKEALDQQNCYNNNAIPFNIISSQSGDLPQNSKSDCIRRRSISKSTSQSPQNPPGSDYTITEYKLTDTSGQNRETRISRVTYNGKPTDIDPTKHGPASQIRLYSYPGSGNVPLMLEFKLSGSGTSAWFYSTGTSGKNWREAGNGDSFYEKDGIHQPTVQLSEQLDKVLCYYYSNVTLNLTKSHSEELYQNLEKGRKNRYCCNDHKDVEKVSIEKKTVSCIHQSTKYYKHSIEGSDSSLGGIYYNDNRGQRRNIKLHGSPFPISGIQTVYTFYCEDKDPLLIYLCGTSPYRGWYKRGSSNNDPWKWIYTGIKPEYLEKNGLECKDWMKLRIVLDDCGCKGLQECPVETVQLDKGKLRQEIREEAEKAEALRNQEISEDEKQKQQSAVQGSPGDREPNSNSHEQKNNIVTKPTLQYLVPQKSAINQPYLATTKDQGGTDMSGGARGLTGKDGTQEHPEAKAETANGISDDPTKLSALTEPQPGPGGDENTTTLPQDVQAEVKAARLSGHPGPPGKVSDKGELVPPAERGKDGVGVLSGGKMSHSTRRNGDASFLTFSSIVQEFGNILKTAVTLLKTSTQQSDEGSSPVLGAVGGNGPQGPAGKADGVSGDKGDVTPTRTSTSEAKTSNSISPSLKAQDADDVPSSVGTQYNAADQPNIAATNDNKVEDTQPGDVGSRGPSPGTSLPSSVSNGGESPPTGTTQAPSTTATTSAPADSPPKESEAAEALAAESAGFTVLTGLGSTSGTLAGSTATFFGGWNLYKHYLDTCIQ
ncbi:hypothetical protein BEWA_022560 [Theileria equi strain WA]|uniref:Uncharacterized protein n=1 Tax=Theileria equi strain WA TaxID=1537102 RepID=L0AW10_THEEQ|nr:hypothetical protein BEWA_022560 [Theileria equi strain WA]AFZ79408.1 hypothetical protein BEWA_022560 [Theileria equi strain WA]|eukprot:XP_004829074.1 hypothetical protein BEWA_022560 [Theileria equi strain WA]